MPVYGLMILIVFWALYVVNAKIGFRVYLPLVLALFVSIIVNGHVNGKSVLFLYKEDVAKISYAKENKDEVAVVMFNPATPHNVWRLTDELLQYDRVFYMNEENVEKLTESDVINADKIILYVADSDLKEAAINNLTDSCTKVQNLTQIDSEDMWTTCEIK